MSCKTIKIKEGHHLTKRLFKFRIGRSLKLKRRIIFDESCRYRLPSPDNLDINKLFGFSEGFNHHKNSIRIGWIYYSEYDCIGLFIYQYIDGKRKTLPIANAVQFNQPIDIQITSHKDIYYITVINLKQKFEHKVKRNSNHWFHYFLYVYFGGNLVAPKDMEIQICKL